MRSLGLLVLRLIVGGVFVAHGYPKLFGGPGKSESLSGTTKATLGEGFAQQLDSGGIDSVAKGMEHMKVPNPKAAAWAVTLAEFGGGIALILGFKTRPAAAALAFSQMVAINKVEASRGLVGGYEFNLTLIGSTIALALTGPGKISLDRK
jgi:putative oxidoreductase